MSDPEYIVLNPRKECSHVDSFLLKTWWSYVRCLGHVLTELIKVGEKAERKQVYMIDSVLEQQLLVYIFGKCEFVLSLSGGQCATLWSL